MQAIIRIEVLEDDQGDALMVSMQGCYYDAVGGMQAYDMTKLSYGNKGAGGDVTKLSGKGAVYEKQTLSGAIANAHKLRSQGAEFQLVTIKSKL